MLARRGREIAAMLLPSPKQLSTTIWTGGAITAYVAHERAAGAQNNVVPWGVGNLFNGPASKKICHFERSNHVYRTCALTFSPTNLGTLIWIHFLFRILRHGCAAAVEPTHGDISKEQVSDMTRCILGRGGDSVNSLLPFLAARSFAYNQDSRRQQDGDDMPLLPSQPSELRGREVDK